VKIDVLARSWGSPAGAGNGMAQAAEYFAETLGKLGHLVRRLGVPDGFGADLLVTTIHPHWRRTAALAASAGALGRLVYWHHAAAVPAEGHGCMLAAPPAIETPPAGWGRRVVLPPSSWAAEAGGECTGTEILASGASPPKGGHVALEVAQLCPDLRWFVLQSRSAPADREPWRQLGRADVAERVVAPAELLARARAVLSPTRFDVHPLLLVEAAVRGIPIVCSDLPGTRAAAGASAIYVPAAAPAWEWAAALRRALAVPLPRLRLRPYAEIVAEALEALAPMQVAA
jgi:hypothetical protein